MDPKKPKLCLVCQRPIPPKPKGKRGPQKETDDPACEELWKRYQQCQRAVLRVRERGFAPDPEGVSPNDGPQGQMFSNLLQMTNLINPRHFKATGD